MKLYISNKVPFDTPRPSPTGRGVGRRRWGSSHCSSQSPLKPRMRYLSLCLRQALRSLDHLLRNSSHLVEQLQRVQISGNDMFWKIDIKDYFLSRNHADLVEKNVKHVFETRKSAFEKARFETRGAHLMGSRVETTAPFKRYGST